MSLMVLDEAKIRSYASDLLAAWAVPVCDLDATRWVVVSEAGLESGPLTFVDAWHELQQITKRTTDRRSGLTVVAVETAGRLIECRRAAAAEELS